MTDGLKNENMINTIKITTLLSIALFFISNIVLAQDCTVQAKENWGTDSVNCRENVSLYSGYLKQKELEDASNFWWKTQKVCPNYKTNLYANGTYIYRTLAKENKETPKFGAYLDTLFIIYDLWIETYGICDEIKMKYAKDIMKNRGATNYNKAYDYYKSAFASNKESASYTDVKFYFYASIYMFNNKKIDCDKFLSIYGELIDLCEYNINKDNKKKGFTSVIAFLDKSISPCASCEKLEEIYSEKVAENPDDIKLTRKVFKMLSQKKCTESAFYLQLLDKVLNDLDNPPTAKDLIMAAKSDYKRGDYHKSEERFERAETLLEQQEAKEECYNFLYDIAMKKKNYKKAFNISSKYSESCEVNAKKSRAVASSASSCGTSPLEKSLIYCLALDYASKSCGKISSSITNSWTGLLLPKKELIMLDITNGSEQTVACWNTKVKLRTKD